MICWIYCTFKYRSYKRGCFLLFTKMFNAVTNFLTAVFRKPAFIIAMPEYDFVFVLKEGNFIHYGCLDVLFHRDGIELLIYDWLALHLTLQEIIMKEVEHYQFLFFEGNDCLNVDHRFPMWRSFVLHIYFVQVHVFNLFFLIAQYIRNLSKRHDQLCFYEIWIMASRTKCIMCLWLLRGKN